MDVLDRPVVLVFRDRKIEHVLREVGVFNAPQDLLSLLPQEPESFD